MKFFKFILWTVLIVIVLIGITYKTQDKFNNNMVCEEQATGNLTYSYYNYTTGEVTTNVTDIPIYSNRCVKVFK